MAGVCVTVTHRESWMEDITGHSRRSPWRTQVHALLNLPMVLPLCGPRSFSSSTMVQHRNNTWRGRNGLQSILEAA